MRFRVERDRPRAVHVFHVGDLRVLVGRILVKDVDHA